MTQEAAAKKDTQKLQRAIVDGLEDVKAQDIQVFNTEHLSPLFERVIVASGTSNRQTKALAASVTDAVREAGFPKPRIEGEDNGEWIIVDCGAAVAHIMQPAIRQYYHLEEIWGDKPIRLRLGAPKPAQPERAPAAPAKKTSGQPSLRRTTAVKTIEREATAAKRAAKKAAATKTPGRSAGAKSAGAKSAGVKSASAKSAPAKSIGAKTTARSPAGQAALKAPARKAPATKPAATKSAAKKAPARKA
jgi:ribosome-associated protein